MLREEVASHYKSKGYTITERARVRGRSGTVHTVDMVAQGPLGNLVIAIEDAGGFEGPEMHAVRRAAKDIGATPVMAARRVPDGLRRQAAEAGVVLLDEGAMAAAAPIETPVDDAAIAYPPWPGQEPREVERIEVVQDWAPRRSKSTDPGFWRYPRDDEPSQSAGSSADPAGAPRPGDGSAVRAAVALAPPRVIDPDEEGAVDVPDRSDIAPPPSFAWLPKDDVAVAPLRRGPPVAAPATGLGKWFIAAILFGATAGGVAYALSRIFG